MKPNHFDVLIVGAGLSGIGMACHLQKDCPHKSYVILEGRESLGGTWDLFRYPGIRSDSDMYTLGYSFKPWSGSKDIADGPSILQYIQDAASEHKVEENIRYGHSVHQVSWSSQESLWTVEVEINATGERVVFSGNMLLMCAGYYSYESGYTPDFPGYERFQGQIVHPQKWPADLDYAGKKVIVIGSGATAVTLVPAIADDAEHVVMLQRSPTYMLSRPEVSTFATLVRKILPAKVAYAIARWWNTTLSGFFYHRSRARPKRVRDYLIKSIRSQLGPDFDVEKHFVPSYNPWDQRLCLVPNGDLFKSINSGKTTMVTDHIEEFTEHGILLKSGRELPADLIVTATGLEMEVLGGIAVVVDGRKVDFSNTFTYLGMMSSNVPNLVTTFGYVNASWTLRADLIAEFTCRLINYMDKRKLLQCTPRLSEADQTMTPRPFIENFSSNYIQRALHRLPKQGDHDPWINTQDYQRDLKLIRRRDLDDGTLAFE